MSEELIETLIKYFSKSPYQEDFVRAKDMFNKIIGTMVEEHPYFDTWISGFFEWYLIDYKMLKIGVPPIYLYQRVFADGLDPKAITYLHQIEQCTLELLEVQSVSGQKVKVTNLYKKTNLEFESHENTALLQKGDFLVTRIMHTATPVRSFGVIWHLSGEIASIVGKKLDQIKTEHDQEYFLYELIKRKTQSEIYSHVPLDQIFAWKTGAEIRVSPRVIK